MKLYYLSIAYAYFFELFLHRYIKNTIVLFKVLIKYNLFIMNYMYIFKTHN